MLPRSGRSCQIFNCTIHSKLRIICRNSIQLIRIFAWANRTAGIVRNCWWRAFDVQLNSYTYVWTACECAVCMRWYDLIWDDMYTTYMRYNLWRELNKFHSLIEDTWGWEGMRWHELRWVKVRCDGREWGKFKQKILYKMKLVQIYSLKKNERN